MTTTVLRVPRLELPCAIATSSSIAGHGTSPVPTAFPLDPVEFGGYTLPGGKLEESRSFLDPLEGTENYGYDGLLVHGRTGLAPLRSISTIPVQCTAFSG